MTLARFTSHDPIMYPDGWNTYAGWFAAFGVDAFGTEVATIGVGVATGTGVGVGTGTFVVDGTATVTFTGGGGATGVTGAGGVGATGIGVAVVVGVGAGVALDYYVTGPFVRPVFDRFYDWWNYDPEWDRPRTTPRVRCDTRTGTRPTTFPSLDAPTPRFEAEGCPTCPDPPKPWIRFDRVPPSAPHFPCPGNHTHVYWYEVYQAPYPACTCINSIMTYVVCH